MMTRVSTAIRENRKIKEMLTLLLTTIMTQRRYK